MMRWVSWLRGRGRWRSLLGLGGAVVAVALVAGVGGVALGRSRANVGLALSYAAGGQVVGSPGVADVATGSPPAFVVTEQHVSGVAPLGRSLSLSGRGSLATAGKGVRLAARIKGSEAPGSLSVALSGLPSGQRPVAVLRGPGGLSRAVPARGLTIAKARVGLYRLTVGSVRITRASGAIKRGAIATALDGTVSVRVVAGRRAVLQGSYTSIINPGVRALSGGALSVGGAADDPSTVVFGGHVALARGAILSLPPSTLLPRGLLSNVVAVVYAAGKTTVSVSAASVYEVAPNYQFDVPLAAAQASAAAVNASCPPASGLSPYADVNGVSFSGGWDTVSVLGVHIVDGVKAAVHFTAAAGLNVTAGAGLACSLSVSFSANGMAGPIPVTATIEGELNGSAAVGGVLTAGGSTHVDAGAHTIGIPPTPVWLPDVSFSNPQFTLTAKTFAQATAGIGLTVKAGIGNSTLANVTLNLGTSLDFSAQPGSCTWDANFGQFSAEGQLLAWHITTPQTPALFTKPLWQSTCGGSSGTGPTGGAPGPTGTAGPTGNAGSTVPTGASPGPALAIAASLGGICALINSGSVYCWGSNGFGELGNGMTGGSVTPTPVTGISTATGIASDTGATVCAVLASGQVLCWGDGLQGELGNGADSSASTPVAVSGITSATRVAVGGYDGHACAVLVTGQVECWGYANQGQLGNGVQMNESNVPVTVSGITDATQVAAGWDHTCALLMSGQIDCWGSNGFGQLGTGPAINASSVPVSVSGIANATQVATGDEHSCALLATGTVDCWGYNLYGELGNGSLMTSSAVPVQVSGIATAIEIAAGDFGACALLADGSVDCWGINGNGQLGNGTMTDSNVPVQVSALPRASHIATDFTSCAVLVSGRVECWGANGSGELGYQGGDSAIPVPISGIG